MVVQTQKRPEEKVAVERGVFQGVAVLYFIESGPRGGTTFLFHQQPAFWVSFPTKL